MQETNKVYGPQSNQTLARSKQQLQDSKDQFLKELNRRDPNWADKIRARKQADIIKMEEEMNRSKKAEMFNLEATTKSLTDQQLREKENQQRTDEAQSVKLRKLKSDYEEEQKRLADLDRSGKLRQISIGKEINEKQRDVESLKR